MFVWLSFYVGGSVSAHLQSVMYSCFRFEPPSRVVAHVWQMQSYGNPPQEILDGLMPGPGGAGGFPFGDMMGAGAGAAGAGEMPPIPPELLNEMQNLDPSKVKEMQDACKTQ